MAGGANGASEAANGGSKKDAHLAIKRCFFVYQVLVGYEVQVQVSDSPN